jgi:ribonuclease Z
VIFLGTSAMAPTCERNVQSIAIEQKGSLTLVDCGEGTLRQMGVAGLAPARVSTILITHWHWDHVGGVVGVLQSAASGANRRHIAVYGPVGTRQRLAHLQSALEGELAWSAEVVDLDPGSGPGQPFFTTERVDIRCAAMSHGCPTMGYSFTEADRYQVNPERAEKLGLATGPKVGELIRQGRVEVGNRIVRREDCCTLQPGARLAIIPDTAPNDNIAVLAAAADLMICEATYASEHATRAQANLHMTATQAAKEAARAGARRLLLTHFSARYAKVDSLVNEARAVFPETAPASDFLTIQMPE